jgi:hypothetical protein
MQDFGLNRFQCILLVENVEMIYVLEIKRKSVINNNKKK